MQAKPLRSLARLLAASIPDAAYHFQLPSAIGAQLQGRSLIAEIHDRGSFLRSDTLSEFHEPLLLHRRCSRIILMKESSTPRMNFVNEDVLNISKAMDALRNDVNNVLRNEPNWDVFAEEFIVTERTGDDERAIRLEGLESSRRFLKLLRRMAREVVEKDDLQVQWLVDDLACFDNASTREIAAVWRVKLDRLQFSAWTSSTSVEIEAKTALHFNEKDKVERLQIDEWLVNGRKLGGWPESKIPSLQANILDILTREPNWRNFAQDFELIDRTGVRVKGLAPNKVSLNLLREFHRRLTETGFKIDYTVKSKKTLFEVDGTLEPVLVSRWCYEIDADSQFRFLNVFKDTFSRLPIKSGFPLKLAGTSVFRFDSEGKVKSMIIDNGFSEFRYFAYGSNLNVDVLARRTGGRSVVKTPPRAALLQNYSLIFNLGQPSGPAAASVEPCSGKVCHGVVYTLDLQQFLAMLASEGVPFAYSLERVIVQPYDSGDRGNRGKRGVQAYTLRSGRGIESYPPSRRYRDLLVKGARAFHLDADWIRWLESLEVAWPTFGIR